LTLTPGGTYDVSDGPIDMADLEDVVARCLSGALPPGSPETTEALIDALTDPDDWEPEGFAVLDRLRLAAGAPRTEHGVVRFERPTVIFGDLVVDGDLECLSHTVVLGDVRCSGYLYSGIHDCVIIAGDLEARSLEALRSYWVIGGSITAETIWLSTYGFLQQRGAVRTRLLMLEMYFELRNEEGVEAETRISTDYLPDDPVALARLQEVVDTGALLGDDGTLESWQLLKRVARGEPVFRAR
jgi:hypothetical protein